MFVPGTRWCSLALEFDIGASHLALHAFSYTIANAFWGEHGESWRGKAALIWGTDSQHGLAPSQGSVAITHWSQACLDVVARVEEEPC